MRCSPQGLVTRSPTIRCSSRRGVRHGDDTGREDPSGIGLPGRNLSGHFLTVAHEHWNRSAARAYVPAIIHNETGKTQTTSRAQEGTNVGMGNSG
jgi:hypothetical protein